MSGQCGLSQTDIVFVLDSSSTSEDDFVRMLQFCKDLIDGSDYANGDIRVGLITYASRAIEQFSLGQFTTKQDIFDAIDSVLQPRGRRNTADAINAASNMLVENARGSSVQTAIFLMTSGISDVKSRRTIREADQAKANGITIYGVGIGLPNAEELHAVVSIPTRETAFLVDRFEALLDLSEQLFLPKCEGN